MARPVPAVQRVLITAGPTHEPIDRVRYLANRSSGRMGIALAEAAAAKGHAVTLLLGPTERTPPNAIAVHRFTTTADLERLLAAHLSRCDVLLMAAAVADYRPAAPPAAGKIRRAPSSLRLDLEPTPDLLAAAVAAARPEQVVIGFALEPAEGLETAARAKLAARGAHAIVANPLETIASETVSAMVLLRDGRALRPPGGTLTKRAFADWLFGQLPAICISTIPSRPAGPADR